MSQVTLKILEKLTPVIVVDTPDNRTPDGKRGIVEVETVPRYYRYIQGDALSNSGKSYTYIHRFLSDPASDAATQAVESEACAAEVTAELNRWLASNLAK